MLRNILTARYGEGSVCAFDHPAKVLDFMQRGEAFDIAVLDILMPDTNGTTLAEELRKGGFLGPIIFLTASNDFASEAFGVRAFDYLLKPVDAVRVNAAFDRLEQEKRQEDGAGIFVIVDRATRRILLCDLLCAEAQGRQVCLRLADGSELRSYMTMRACAAMLLEDRRFALCHHSYIVNLDYVETVTGTEALLQDGICIPISRRYGDGFRTSYLKRTMQRGRRAWL